MSQSRQLAAIMFTDIVGYTALMGQDSEKALELVRISKEIQKPLVEKHNGKWLKEMGDGVMAQFGSAIDAVNCSLEIQESARAKLDAKLRIGIHLGDVVVEENDVYGDGVNVASRLESIADPGGICISESVEKSIQGQPGIEAKYLGEVELKNVAYGVRIYALQGGGLPSPSAKTLYLRRRRLPRYVLGVIFLILAAVILYIQYYGSEDSKLEKVSIAVLPFRNLSNDPAQAYLVDGLHDAIIGKLSQIPDLRVISRTSTLRFRDTTLPIADVAEQLKVINVIEGSVLEKDERFLVQVQLIEAFPQESHLWSQEYEKDMSELLSIQGDVAIAIAERMNVDASNLSISDESENPEVYKLYLRGMHALDKGTTEDMLAGMEHLKKGVELDPTAAFAYAGLAQGYVILGHSSLSKPEHFIKAKAAANQALKINPNLADAYAALADVKMYYDWDYPSAKSNFLKATQLKPSLEVAHAHYTWLHVIHEDWDQAIYEGNLTTEIDPFSANYAGWLAWLYWWAGRYDKAIEWAHNTLELNPNYSAAHMVLGSAYAEKGLFPQAIDTLKRAVEITPLWVSHLARAYMLNGNRKDANKLLEKWGDDPRMGNRAMASLHAVLGNSEQAMDYLEKMLSNQSRSIPWIHANPIFRGLHSNSRFLDICRKGNIPEDVLQSKNTAKDESATKIKHRTTRGMHNSGQPLVDSFDAV